MINYQKIFSILPEILDLPLEKKGKRWCLAAYIDLRVNRRRDKLVFYINKAGSITVTEQGGDSMSIFKWLEMYSDCKDASDVYRRLDGDNKIKLDTKQYIGMDGEDAEKRYVEEKYITRLMGENAYSQNALYVWLCGLFGKERVLSVFKAYKVGCIGNTSIFWKTKRTGQVCNDNRIEYGADGRRNKEKHAYRKFKTDEGFSNRGYFGWHLVGMNSTKKVCVVESEKTALICAIAMPEKTWIASAGMNQLHYIGKGWHLYPDYADEAIAMWKGKGEVVSWWDDTCERNDDIGDMVVRMVGARDR